MAALDKNRETPNLLPRGLDENLSDARARNRMAPKPMTKHEARAILEANHGHLIEKSRRYKAAAVIGGITLGLGSLVAVVENMGPAVRVPDPNKPHKVYIAKPGDTAWDISDRAFPNADPREHTDMITKETGAAINPGEKVILPDSSEIGTEVPGNSN